jgi:hypothetical protein
MAASPQPAPAPKRGHMLRNIGIGCGGLLLLLITIVVASNAATKTGSPGSSPAANEPGSASATAKASSAPKVLLDVQGTGTKSTNKFTAGGDWDLTWSYDCSSFGSQGNFQVILYGQNSSDLKGIPVNELGAKGNDVTHEHDSGTFYLEMNSECAWHVTVTG